VAEARQFEIECKSVLTKSKIPSIDYALNPYLGCVHGCVYCYATFMAKFQKVEGEWGSFVGVKVNAPAVLARELERRPPGVVCLGTVCDAYQPAERKHRISRACLEAFVGREGFEVGVLTKSDLVLRDVDVLTRLESPDVGITVTCLDDRLAAVVEPGAPPPTRRLDAMRALADHGVPVWGFFGPILPTFSDTTDEIARVLGGMKAAGADHVLVDRLNLYPRVWSRFRDLLAREYQDHVDAVASIKRDPERYETELRRRVEDVAATLGIAAELCF